MLFRPRREVAETEALALGALADLDGLSKLARQAVEQMGAGHPVSREILEPLDRK